MTTLPTRSVDGNKIIRIRCIGHERPRAAGLLWRAEEMREWICHVNKRMRLLVWMWCIISMNEIECIIRNSTCTLLRKFRRENTLGEMWAAVIRTINNLLRTVWLRTQPQIGDKAGVSWCSEGDHAGHIREVPQEEDSPSTYIAQIMCVCQRGIYSQMSSLL